MEVEQVNKTFHALKTENMGVEMTQYLHVPPTKVKKMMLDLTLYLVIL